MVSHFNLLCVGTTQAWMCIVCLIALRKYRRLQAPLRVLTLYILISAFLDVVKDTMAYHNIHTLWLSQCFSIIELALFLTMFRQWNANNRMSTLMGATFILYLAVWIVGKFSFEPFTVYDTYSGAVSQIIQIGFGSWLLLSLTAEDNFEWKNDPRFWVISGIVLYAAATFFLFGMFNVLVAASREFTKLVMNANLVFTCLEYSFFLRGIFCSMKTDGRIAWT
jgi:hypothetical protein